MVGCALDRLACFRPSATSPCGHQLDVGLMLVCVNEELQHFRMPMAISSQLVVETIQEVLR